MENENEQLRDEATTRNLNRDKSTSTTTNCNPNENRDSPVILKKCVNQKEKIYLFKSSYTIQFVLGNIIRCTIQNICDGERQNKYVCWLYYKDNTTHCKLCEKFSKKKNTNGKIKPEEPVDSFCYKVYVFINVSLL